MHQKETYKNFVEVIASHVEQMPEKKALTFIPNGGESKQIATFGDLDQKAKMIAGILKKNAKKGDRALLLYEKDIEFVYSFVGCLYAGLIAVPVFPPIHSNMYARLKHIIQDATPSVCLMDTASSLLLSNSSNLDQNYKNFQSINTENLDHQWINHYTPAELDLNNIAFLQYTSGSTGNPKGVMVTHGNLLNQEGLLRYFMETTKESVIVSCLPLYHDMGLIGNIMHACYMGCQLVMIPNQRLLRSPLSWLKTITEYKGTTSGGPNFAYELCIRAANPKRLQQLDLSSWTVAFAGGEPVRHGTLKRFEKTFGLCGFKPEAWYPSYGMAETTLAVTGGKKKEKVATIRIDKKVLSQNRVTTLENDTEDSLTLIGNGTNPDDHRVEIIDPVRFKVCGENEIGEIWVSGPSVAAGYWEKTELTKKTFLAQTDKGDGPFLKTGDLGFKHNNILYVSGRLKDIIIINGRNYYPQDIEMSVESCHPKIRFGRVAAFSVENGTEESLCVVAEYKGKANAASQVFNAIRLAISQDIGIKASEIVLVKTKTLPFTTSGKIRRRDTKKAFLAGKLEIISSLHGTGETKNNQAPKSPPSPPELTEQMVTEQIVKAVSQKLQMPANEIDLDAPLGQYGLSSMDAVELSAELEELSGIPFSPTLVYKNPTIKALVRLIQQKSIETETNLPAKPAKVQDTPIAIIGMGCNFPSAPNIEAYWQLLESGVNAVSKVPNDRPGLSAEELAKESQACQWGAFIEDVAGFDAKFFGLSAAEAELVDPQHRKMMEVVWTTIENAGYDPVHLAGSQTGVFAGISSNDYNQIACSHSLPTNAYTATGLSHALLANRLSYFLDLHGPSETVDTACSSALVAVHRAIQSIRNGECDQAIAGGVNLLLSPTAFSALGKAGFLSEDGVCKTFDASANGYVRGEGVGAILLKPLSEAIKHKDPIYAVIKGSALNHGGKTASLTSPSETAQASLLKKAYENADIDPQSITYIETHGTGTVLGDPIEINGIKQAFIKDGALNPQNGSKKHCGLGSVKTNIGHLEAAAGIAGVIKTALALQHKKIPATINFKQQNPYIDLDNTPFYIVSETKEWTAVKDRNENILPRRAGISSFGFGGTNAHLVLEEAPTISAPAETKVGPSLILLSGKTPDALAANIQNFIDFIESNYQLNGHKLRLADIAYTLQTGKKHLNKRAAIISSSKTGLLLLLKLTLAKIEEEDLFFFEGAGAMGYRQLKVLGELAESWLKGKKIDWIEHSRDSNVKRVALPGYQFERTSYWLPIDLMEDKKEVVPVTPPPIELTQGSIPPPPLEPSPSKIATPKATVKEVTQWLLEQASLHNKVPQEEIDPQSTFEEIGLDSIALINIHGRIKEQFDADLDISVIQEYPNINSLARLIAKEETFEVPDLNQEFAAECLKFNDQLKETINTSEKPIDQGLGKAILLTGSTGFLGSFLLRQLVLNTDADIYCLVRASDEEQGLERINRMFEKFHISDCELDSRIHILCGDLAKVEFGIDGKTYEALAQIIDTVFHSGAIVDWMKPYMSLKNANVGGTVEAIKFCGYRKIKKLNYVSSLAVLPLIEERPKWLESDEPPAEKLTNGYAQSKWVAEKLCFEARNLGLCVNVYRFDYVAASTQTGSMKESDFIVRLVKGCIQLGCIPLEEVNFDILSIDYLSSTMLHLAKLNQSKTYHLLNRQPFITSDFTKVIRKYGYKLERIPFEIWKDLVQTESFSDLYPLYPFINQYTIAEMSQYYMARVDNTNVLTALYEIDPDLIKNVPPAETVMAKTLSYFKTTGHLPPAKYKSVLNRQRSYWIRQLEGAPKRLELPFKSRESERSETIKNTSIEFDNQLVDNIKTCCHKERVSIAEGLLAAFQIFLFRYTRQKDIPLAVSFAYETESKNFLAPKTPIIRTQLIPEGSFKDTLHSIKQVVAEAYVNLDLPSDEIAHSLYAISDDLKEIVYDTVFIYRDKTSNQEPTLNFYPLKWQEVPQKFNGLRLLVEHSDDGIKGAFEYSEHQFEEDTIKKMTKHFGTLLSNLVEMPDTKLLKAPIMSSKEEDKLLLNVNGLKKSYPSDKLVHNLISRQAQIRPDAIALKMGSKSMTYQALEDKAQLFAKYLKGIGATNGDLIGICMEKSFELIIGLLGTLKAGCAYFPVDPTYPEDRKRYMVEIAGANIILALKETQSKVPKTEAKIICLDDNWEDSVDNNIYINDTETEKSEIAYMIFTSGSTGLPKGVKVYHRGLVNLLFAYNEDVRIDHNDCVITSASLSYDASVIEIFYPLVHGGTLALLPTDASRDGQKLRSYLESNSITFMTASVATWRMLDYAGWQGDSNIKLVNGGEALPFDLAQTLIKWSKAAFNAYGPAETSVCVSMKKLEPEQTITIGRPLANTRIYILDEYLNPMPIGVAGELYIGGDGVAQGYHKRPEMTAAKFIQSPFSQNSSARLYKTGDLARLLPNGEIEFIGRIDNQVKLRGHRIELGEIESALEKNDHVKAATVLTQQETGKEKKIVAYIIPATDKNSVNISKIKKGLKKFLPSFMLPSDYVLMDAFPVTLGGKIDRTAFPMPKKTALIEDYTAPKTPIEIQLADIWKDILDLDRVGIQNSFLDLGGDSIKAMKLLIAINKQFNSGLTVQGLYENLTISELSKAILNNNGTTGKDTAQVIDYDAEAKFDFNFDRAKAANLPIAPPHLKRLFLTGATGYLGAYILQNILNNTTANVYCLVRCDTPAEGMARIKKNMKQNLLWKDSYKSRIKPIVGDLAQPNLGVVSEKYDLLAKYIDAIYHCGSVVNFAYPYNFLKKSNVNGTKEIIRFASRKRIKYIFYVSTIGVFEQNGLFSNQSIGEDHELPDPQGLFFGYSQSKWISEKIVLNAMEKGMPISVYRPGSVLGHSATGVSNRDDLVNVMIKVFNIVGAIPDVDFQMNGLPVDFVADSIVKLSFRPEATGKRFHIVNPNSVSVRKLIDYYLSYGYRMPVVPYQKWYELLAKKADSNDYLLPYVPVIEKELTSMNGSILPDFQFDNTQKLLKDYQQNAPIIDENLFHLYLKYLEGIGFISKQAGKKSSLAA